MNEFRVQLRYKTDDRLSENQVANAIKAILEAMTRPLATVEIEKVIQVRDND